MEKILDLLAKYLPAPIVVALLAVAVAFISVHYWRGFRDYRDTTRDHVFLSLAVVVVAATALFLVNRSPAPSRARPPLLLVPFFENDEREQYRMAFASQLEHALSRLGGNAGAVYQLPIYLAEQTSAIQNAKRYGAVAAIYQPVVIREKDSVKACFHIAYLTADGSKPYAMVPLEVPGGTLDEIALTLVGGPPSQTNSQQANPILSRLDALEGQVNALRAVVDRATARQRENSAPGSYRNKFAMVIGVDDLSSFRFSLRYAVSDAQSVALTLNRFGFETTTLLGNKGTKEVFLNGLDRLRQRAGEDDLVVIYYAGPSIVGQSEKSVRPILLLPLADFDSNIQSSALTINELAEGLRMVKAHHKLVILDGCHGTTGLEESSISAGLAASSKPNSAVLQFFAGSGNEEYGLESAQLGGGAFTQALVRVLGDSAQNERGIWMHELVAKTTAFMKDQPNIKQTPKLLTLSGEGEIYWSPSEKPIAR